MILSAYDMIWYARDVVKHKVNPSRIFYDRCGMKQRSVGNNGDKITMVKMTHKKQKKNEGRTHLDNNHGGEKH